MSPKRAGPKAKAKVKAKAKAVPRLQAPALRRPAARVLVRPARHEEREEAPERGSPMEDFRQGMEADLHAMPFEVFKIGARMVVSEGSYYGGQCQVAGRIREVSANEKGTQVSMLMTGTGNEELLKYGTSVTDKRIQVHLCPPDCVGEPHGPVQVHGKKGFLVSIEKEPLLTWEKNMELIDVDELEKLRALQKEADQKTGGDKKENASKKAKKDASSSSEKKGKKKKKVKKKKDKKAKEKTDGQEAESPEDSSEGETKKKKKKKRERNYGGRSIAQKDPAMVYAGTGMDPKKRVRRKVAAYAKKKCKRKKDSTSSTSSSSQGSSESTGTEEGTDALQDQGRIRQLHRHGPGLLSSTALQRMQNVLTDVEGIWNKGDSGLAPVALRYVRSQLGGKLTGASLKEAITLGACVDLLAQARVAEACDYMVQRLKSLEKISQGVGWQTTERLELAPGLVPQISSLVEMQQAKKEARLEQDHRGGPGTWTPKGGAGKGTKKGKSDEKGKGKRKEGGQKPPQGANQ